MAQSLKWQIRRLFGGLKAQSRKPKPNYFPAAIIVYAGYSMRG
jgi:hypothetical protein